MNSYSIMEEYFKVHMYFIDRLRLYYVLKYLPIWFIYALSYVIGKALYIFSPILRFNIYKTFTYCFPKLTRRDLNQLANAHIVHLVFHNFLTSILPFLSTEQFHNLFDYEDLRKVIDQRKNCVNIIVGSHFFSILLITLLSELFFQADTKLCASFACDEAYRIHHYATKITERFHWDYHIPILVDTSVQNNFGGVRQLRQFLQQGKGTLFIFSDVRLRSSSSDITYKVGDGTLYASRGFKFCMDNLKDLDYVIPVYLRYEKGRFKVIVSDLMSPRTAHARYYEQVLPEQIQRECAQWELWYMSPILMDIFG